MVQSDLELFEFTHKVEFGVLLCTIVLWLLYYGLTSNILIIVVAVLSTTMFRSSLPHYCCSIVLLLKCPNIKIEHKIAIDQQLIHKSD